MFLVELGWLYCLTASTDFDKTLFHQLTAEDGDTNMRLTFALKNLSIANTCPCNILQFSMAVKNENFQMKLVI